MVDNIEFRVYCSIVYKFINKTVQKAFTAKYQDGKSADVHCFLNALIEELRKLRALYDKLLNVMLVGRDETAYCLT